MFEKIGQFAGLLQQLPKMRAEAEQLRERLGQHISEGDAGGGMVRVRINGRFEVQKVVLSEEALRLQDREMLEDLIRAATNQALRRVGEHVAGETSKVVSGLNLPSGFGFEAGSSQ